MPTVYAATVAEFVAQITAHLVAEYKADLTADDAARRTVRSPAIVTIAAALAVIVAAYAVNTPPTPAACIDAGFSPAHCAGFARYHQTANSN